MSNTRLEDLRLRFEKDSASIAFAQLAEELRREGQYQESIEVCRAGLAIHPTYLSARVTLGRALLKLEEFDAAQREFEYVLGSTPENLAAVRGLADIHHRRGALGDALVQYRTALTLARHDPVLEQRVEHLSHALQPMPPTAPIRARAPMDDVSYRRALRTIAELDRWLTAIHALRTNRSS